MNKKVAGSNSTRISPAISAPSPEPSANIETGIKRPNAQRLYLGSFLSIWIPITNMDPMAHPKKANRIALQSIGGCADLAEIKAEGPKNPPIISATIFINNFFNIGL